MKQKEINIDHPNFIDIKILSDLHIGARPFLDMKAKSEIDWVVKKPNRYLFLNGDICNCALVRSMSNTYENKLTPHQELKYARKFFSPAKKKILGVTEGNHERRIRKETSLDICEEIALHLNVYYSRECLYIKINLPKVSYQLFIQHGWTGSRLPGGKANRLYKLRHIAYADIYGLSHSHQQITFPMSYFLNDSEKHQMYINTGHYLNYDDYAVRKSYVPSPPGTPLIRLYNDPNKKIESRVCV